MTALSQSSSNSNSQSSSNSNPQSAFNSNPQSSSIDYCQQDLTKYTHILGAGAFGNVHLIKNGLVIKGFEDNEESNCTPYQHEYNIQLEIFTLFAAVDKSKFPFLKGLEISKPIQFCPFQPSYDVGNNQYQCLLVMTKLNGIPISILQQLMDRSDYRTHWKNFDETYLNELISNDVEIMVHPEMRYSDRNEASYKGKDWDLKITQTNPLRGYFLGRDRLIKFLRKLLQSKIVGGLKISDPRKDINRKIGFVDGYMLRKGELIPCDIEFALGLYGNELRLNVMDFGLVYDLKGGGSNSRFFRECILFDQVMIKQWLDSTKKDWSKLETETLQSLGRRISFTNVESPYVKQAWSIAFVESCCDEFENKPIIYEKEIKIEYNAMVSGECVNKLVELHKQKILKIALIFILIQELILFQNKE